MSQAPGAPMNQPAGAPAATATLGVRFAARLLDGLLVGIPAAIVLTIFGLNAGGLGLSGWIGSAITSILWFGYFVYFESSTGSTVGKRLLKVRVVAPDGTPPSMEAAAKRNVWMLFGLVPFVGALVQFIAVIVIAVTISGNEFNRGKHDEFADTGVVV